MAIFELMVVMTAVLSVFCVACVIEKIVEFFMKGERKCS